jgi:hypothetical protein
MSFLGASWRTTVIGFVAGVASYFAAMGANLPTDRQGWTTAIVSAAIFALGATAKDGNVSNAPNPTIAKTVTPVTPVT